MYSRFDRGNKSHQCLKAPIFLTINVFLPLIKSLLLHSSETSFKPLYHKAIRKVLIAATLCFFLPLLAWAELHQNPNSVKKITGAYGFILGQETSLARIEQSYPAMAMQVEVFRSRFNAVFPDIRKKLERELISAIGESKFRELALELRKGIEPLLRKQPMSPDLAASFLEKVKGRAKGDFIEPDILRYLLAVYYNFNPAGEFLGKR